MAEEEEVARASSPARESEIVITIEETVIRMLAFVSAMTLSCT
jgi:hypothetical protein